MSEKENQPKNEAAVQLGKLAWKKRVEKGDALEHMRALNQKSNKRYELIERAVCKYCQSGDTVKLGKIKGRQRHRCKNCGKSFLES